MNPNRSPVETQEKGKRAEFYTFGELLKHSADLYLPVIDQGVDAIVRRGNGDCIEIQVKGTEAPDQAGYFNVYDLNNHRDDRFYIVCVDMNQENVLKDHTWPNAWVLPASIYRKYMTGQGHLAVYERSQRHGNEPRVELLDQYYKDWRSLIAGPQVLPQ